jgi:choline dehydrogenase-like flavoprotein
VGGVDSTVLYVSSRSDLPSFFSLLTFFPSLFLSHKRTVAPNHHLLGTAAMLPRELGGVVDPQPLVYGTENVRVVDASVLPTQVSGHLTGILYAVAERARILLRRDGGLVELS